MEIRASASSSAPESMSARVVRAAGRAPLFSASWRSARATPAATDPSATVSPIAVTSGHTQWGVGHSGAHSCKLINEGGGDKRSGARHRKQLQGRGRTVKKALIATLL